MANEQDNSTIEESKTKKEEKETAAEPQAQAQQPDARAEVPEATPQAEATVKPDTQPEMPHLNEDTLNEALFDQNNLGVLNNVSITLTIEIGRAQIKIRDLLKLSKGSIVELNKSAGEPVDIYANGKLIAMGNIITANGKYCVRITSIANKSNLGLDS